MNASRSRNLLVASGLAAVAAVLTMVYVGHGKGGTARAAADKTVPVLVATRDLPVGTAVSKALADGALRVERIPPEAFGSDSLASAASIRHDVVIQPVYAGDQVSARRLGQSGAAGVRSVLAGAMRVMQVPGDGNQLLAGTLQDGDHVDVFASVTRGKEQRPAAGIVLRDVLVLRAPTETSDAPGASSSYAATVAVTDAQASRLFYVLKNGNWTFVLRPASGASPSNVPPIGADGVLLKG
jgi:Flp pilus assembly protein CpaB